MTGDESSPGINGGLMGKGGPFSGTVNTVEVEDIDAVITKVKTNGGEIIFGKDTIPTVGYLAYFRDNTGIIVGLMQSDSQAGM